jgi:hypothetical protein
MVTRGKVYEFVWRFNMFESVVVVVFQSVFRAEMYQNDVFLFFKNYF